MKFFERAHVKDVLAFLRVKENTGDEASWLRLLSLQNGVGDVTAGKVVALIREHRTMAQVATAPIAERLGTKASVGWTELAGILRLMVAAPERPSGAPARGPRGC